MGPNGSPTCGSEREVKCLFDHVKHSESCLCNRSPVLGDHHSHTLLHKDGKEKEKKNFFFIQHLSKDNFHMLTFTKGHFKAWLTPLLPPPPSDEDEAAGSSSFSCIAISFEAVVSAIVVCPPTFFLLLLSLFPNRVNLGSVPSSSFDDKKWTTLSRLSMATSCRTIASWDGKRGG